MSKPIYKRGTTLEEWCLAEGRTDILEQFDYERNYPKTPKDYMKSSDKKIFFKYDCGCICPPQRIADKTSKNIGCPVCLNRGVVGKSLATEYPEIAKMFDEDKNGISANTVSRMNGKEYWWKCLRCGTPFIGKVAHVVLGKQGCRVCGNKRRTTPEYILEYYLKKLDDKLEMDKRIAGYKFDIYMPKYKLVIEYDGYPWHNTLEAKINDSRKDDICQQRGFTLIRLRDSRLDENKKLHSIIYQFIYDEEYAYLQGLKDVIRPLVGHVADNIDIDVVRDYRSIGIFRKEDEAKNSLVHYMPCITQYIDDTVEKNGDPEYIVTATHKIRLWLRHPVYKNLKWSMTAHDLYAKKEPETQWIKMCIKVLEKYPELEEQVINVGNNIRESTLFSLQCDCGRMFYKEYASIIAKNRKKVVMCERCLREYRLMNLENIRKKSSVPE